VGVSTRTAGAIDSVTWGGTQFVNTFDHGREWQAAASFDGYGECFNPTEAGSNADGAGPRSTSLLMSLTLGPGRLETRSRMAYWMRPGEQEGTCPKGPGPYAAPRSDDILDKHILIGAEGVPNAIAFQATFTMAAPHSQATFEAATAYMPPQFTRFWTYDPATGALDPLSATRGEQTRPVILATPDGSRAMGVYSPSLPQAGQAGGYGWFDFSHLPVAGNATVKWNCVFREGAVEAGPRRYTCYALVGTLEDVTQGMARLRTALSGQASPPARPVPVEGTALYVGVQGECNAGIVTVEPAFRHCATRPLGATRGVRGQEGQTALFVGVTPQAAAGVVTTNPRHLDGTTRAIGFLAAPGSAGTPLYVGLQAECNAGVVSTNPAHLNCGTAPIGSVGP
jgi:hypothetical protein